MRRDQVPSPLSALGLSAAEERLYRALLRTRRMSPEAAAELLGSSAEAPEFTAVVDNLMGRGLLMRAVDDLVAAPPEQALGRLVSDEHQRLQTMREQLAAVRGMLPALEAEHRLTRSSRGEVVQVQAIRSREVIGTLQSLVHESHGDLLWMRPDQWRTAEGEVADAWVGQLLGEGRRSRAIYPARVLEEAPDAVRRRAERGEHVRVLGDVPGRLAVLGDTVALIPNRFDLADDVVLLVRQPAVVTSLILLFESLWERALVVPGLGDDEVGQAASARRLLLDQLAHGSKDEQIARTLGLSLRTVRRRVAELMDELDANSRFQAGVEAIRRGWL